jgi:hypothetical protein
MYTDIGQTNTQETHPNTLQYGRYLFIVPILLEAKIRLLIGN